MADLKHYRIDASEATIKIDIEAIKNYTKTGEIQEIIGQPRALKAIQMGIGIKAKGYNIFVSGFSGTGKRTTVKKILENIKTKEKVELKDIVFVYNFKKPDCPNVLYFPAGMGKEFKKELHQIVENLKSQIKVKLESKIIISKKEKIMQMIDQRENKFLSEFETRLAKDNFHIVQRSESETQITDIYPMYKGQAADFDELQNLVTTGEITEALWNHTREKYYQYMDEMKRMFKELRSFRSEMEKKIIEIDIKAIKPIIETEIETAISHYDFPAAKEYLKNIEKDINENIYLFTIPQEELGDDRSASFSRYGVNIAVDNSGNKKPPVIFEHYPAMAGLFGTVESKADVNGVIRSDFMMIKAGSLLQASGGYLVLQADELFKEDTAWQKLKNVLSSGKVEIYPAESNNMFALSKIKTEPVKVDAKVIIIGNNNLYDFLYAAEEDFHKLFKISAEFDSSIPFNKDSIKNYIGFINMIIKDENLKKINPSGIAKIIEYGARIAEEKNYLTSRFSQIADIIRESDYWAGQMNKKKIDQEAVHCAINERNYLFNLQEEKLSNLINTGDIMINISGKRIGCINGLAVYDRGYYSFGRPVLISAKVAPGDNGVINIEREAGLSGEYHDKGLLILEGFIRSHYAWDFPLSITASICFEQSYHQVDGDSASSSEIYALLSAITGVGLRQDIAVTGSVNQMGEIQPIGGVTEKIEGFFKVCTHKGLTGKQGVIIPRQNIKNLILCDEVIKAISNSMFHIYPITHINEGLEILTGMEAGTIEAGQEYTKESLNAMIRKNLMNIALTVKEFGSHNE